MEQAPNVAHSGSKGNWLKVRECSDPNTYFMSKYKFRDGEALEQLLETLSGYASRDQWLNEHPMAMSTRRKRGYALAKALVNNARVAISAIESISDSIIEFNKVVYSSPSLIEEIFDVDMTDPYAPKYPDEITILLGMFEEPEFWDSADSLLQRMAAMPIRPRLKRGIPADIPLRKAIFACKAFWRDREDRDWSRYRLRETSIRGNNDPDDLKGECEKFVRDALTWAHIKFSLKTLNSAWQAVDDQQ